MAPPEPSASWVLGCLAVGVPALGWMALRARSAAGAAPRGAAAPEPLGLALAGAMIFVWLGISVAAGLFMDLKDAPLWRLLAVDGVGKGAALGLALGIRAALPGGEKGTPAPAGAALRAGAVAALAFLPVMIGISWIQRRVYDAAGLTMEGQDLVNRGVDGDGTSLACLAFFAVVVAPVFEETLFRRFLYGGLRLVIGPWIAAIFSSALFAGYHGEVEVLPVTFALGLGACWLRERTGGLLAPMAMHACYNAVQVAGILSAKGG